MENLDIFRTEEEIQEMEVANSIKVLREAWNYRLDTMIKNHKSFLSMIMHSKLYKKHWIPYTKWIKNVLIPNSVKKLIISIRSHQNIHNASKLLENNRFKEINFLIINIKDQCMMLSSKFVKSIWKIGTKVKNQAIFQLNMTAKQFIMIFHAYSHWKTVSFSSCQISDEGQKVKLNRTAKFEVKNLDISGFNWGIIIEILKCIHQNESLSKSLNSLKLLSNRDGYLNVPIINNHIEKLGLKMNIS